MASPSWSNGEDFDTATWMDGHPRETPSMERDLELALRIAEEDIILSYWRDQMAERKDQCEEESRQQGSPPVSEEPVNKKFAPQYSAADAEVDGGIPGHPNEKRNESDTVSQDSIEFDGDESMTASEPSEDVPERLLSGECASGTEDVITPQDIVSDKQRAQQLQLEMDEELAVLLHCQVGMHPQQEACVKTAGKVLDQQLLPTHDVPLRTWRIAPNIAEDTQTEPDELFARQLQMDEENAAASTAGHKLEAPFVNGPSLVEVDGAIDDFHDTDLSVLDQQLRTRDVFHRRLGRASKVAGDTQTERDELLAHQLEREINGEGRYPPERTTPPVLFSGDVVDTGDGYTAPSLSPEQIQMWQTAIENNDYEAMHDLEEEIGEVKKRGLSREDLDFLRSMTQSQPMYNSHNVALACRVCLDLMEKDQSVCSLPCLHRFHADCIDRWLQVDAVCPVCKHDLKEYLKKQALPW